jgi:acyl-CoA thioester hydrolase
MERLTHEYELLIQENHLDTFGHVNNATYLQIFEQARWDMITTRGYGVEKIQSSRLGPVILEAHVKFRREIKNRTLVVVRSELVSYEGMIGRLRQRVFKRGEKEQMACEAVFRIALWNLDARKLVEPTPEWAYAVMLGD